MIIASLFITSILLWVVLACFWMMPDVLDFLVLHYNVGDGLFVFTLGIIALWMLLARQPNVGSDVLSLAGHSAKSSAAYSNYDSDEY